MNEAADESGKPDEGDIFCICSAYDWMPMKMKTKRRLELEKLSMLDNAPPSILTVDNV